MAFKLSENVKDACDDLKSCLKLTDSKFDDVNENREEILRFSRGLLHQLGRLQLEVNSQCVRGLDVVPRSLKKQKPSAGELINMMNGQSNEEALKMMASVDQDIINSEKEIVQNKIHEYLDTKRMNLNKMIDDMLTIHLD